MTATHLAIKTLKRIGLSVVVLLLLIGCSKAKDKKSGSAVNVDALVKEAVVNLNSLTTADREKLASKAILKYAEGLDDVDSKRVLFGIVQSFPYRLRHWEPNNSMDLFVERSGDCRHKRDALFQLYKDKGFAVRKVTVLYNYADLPLPKNCLAELSETRDFHSGMEVKTSNGWTRVDATWDPLLAKYGFPLTTTWDGESPTKNVTDGECVPTLHTDYNQILDLYRKYNVKWPKQSENAKFVKCINSWLGDIRSK